MQEQDQELKNKVPSPDLFHILTKEEQEAVLELDSIKHFKKGTILIKESQTPCFSYYVVSGIVRKYRTNDEGEEITMEFYSDQESVFTTSSSKNPQPSKFSLQCLEDCKISVVPYEKEQEMYARFPRFERMCRETTERDLVAYQEKFANYMSWSPEQRYLDLLNNRPDLIERVPQFQLASYLGVKPESLSRIRKRIAEKGKV